MLQKLENVYLAVLRFFVITAAGVLLLAVVGFGASSIMALRPQPIVDRLPAVSDEQMKREFRALEAEGARTGEATAAPSRQAVKADANREAYERATGLMTAFVSRHSNGRNVLNPQRLEDFIRQRAKPYRDEDLQRAFATGLADNPPP